ncbi:apolipoprotein N-acyltransferase [Zhouia sp. PK063]|uniref:apolipoprotein N-acyltransferase n=1 Tax=Zhouia sp. PK063 TaxID=3373602 RepID=UPI0037A5903F
MTKNTYLLAVLSGILFSISWPTYGFPLFIFIAFVPLLLAEYTIRNSEIKRKGRKTFLTAYLTFFIWNFITTWWIYNATAGGMLFAVIVNSLLMTIVFWLYHIVAKRLPSKIHLVFLPAIWMAFEKFHLNWDFSWPWLNLGNVFSNYTTWVQWYEYTGTFGGDLWIWLINIGVFTTILNYQSTKNSKVLSTGIAKQVLLFAIPVAISFFMYQHYEPSKKTIKVMALQPNVDPYSEKYDISNLETAKNLIRQIENHYTDSLRYVLAPETVFAAGIDKKNLDHAIFKNELLRFLSQHPNLNFLGGIAMYHKITNKSEVTPQSNYLQPGLWFNDYNTALFLNHKDSLQLYNKSKLVVGVENFPFKTVLEPVLGNMMIDLGGTVATKTTQKERTNFIATNNTKVAPIICYESIYGEFVSHYVQNGANFLAIITNDGWWGNTQGYKQHMSYAKLRAVETRKSVVRSANTGVSAIINPKGDVVKSLAYNQKGVVVGNISINNTQTFYVRYGDYLARLGVLLSVVIFISAFVKRRSDLV